MKKISLCVVIAMVLSVMLFAQESEPSEIVGYVAYDIVTGVEGRNLNYVALPMTPEWEMASQMGNAYEGLIDAIETWDAANQIWESAFVVEGTWVDDYAIEAAHAYMMNITDAFTFYSVGTLADDIQYNLVLGVEGRNINSLMVPLNRPDLTMADQLGIDIGPEVDAVDGWVAATQVWDSAFIVGEDWIDSFPISIGMPLNVNVTQPVTWPAGEERIDDSRTRIQPVRRMR